MGVGSLRACAAALLCVVLGACGSGGSGPQPPQPSPPDQPQAIAFANAGPLSGAVATSVTNAASGGAGTGAITYSSSNTAVATVSAAGVASLLTAGTTTITATKAASAGFLSATATYALTVTPAAQNMFLTYGGTRNVLLSDVLHNPGTGGAGTGAFSYASSNPQAVTVNASGTATAVGVGTAVITVTKAGDANYLPAQASYTLNVQTAGSVSAWIGSSSTEVHMPASANGHQLGRAAVSACNETTPAQWNCSFGALTPVTGTVINDSIATLTSPAYYAIENNSVLGQPIVVNHRRFSERIGHGAVRFNNRYWLIGGAIPSMPRTGATTTYLPQSDVWSSIDGRSWRLETESAAFGARWLHQTLVHDGAIWVLGGIRQGSSGYNDVWRSTDGVNWLLVTNVAPFLNPSDPNPSPTNVAATVFGNAMWVVRNGRSWSSTDGLVWTQRSPTNAIGGSNASRAYASLTAYNGALWYIGGGLNHVGATATTPAVGDTVADVFRSNDGITWTQVVPTASFGARFTHSAFVLNGRLWIAGGRAFSGGVFSETGTTYSTTDGQAWRQEALTTEVDRAYLSQVIEESTRVTLVAGVHRSYSSKVWQTTDGSGWTELAPVAFVPRLLADGVSFNGYLWLIGGGRTDSHDTSEVWRSADGVNWSQVTPSGSIFSGRSSHRVVAFNNRLWVIGGLNYFGSENGGAQQFSNEVWSSPDGANWTQHANPQFAPRSAHAAVVFNNRLWVIGGTNASGQLNDVWSSTDGETWARETDNAAFTARWGHQVVALNNEMWLIGGGIGAGEAAVGNDEIWRSTDGRTWTQAAAGARFSARTEHAATVLNGRIYLAGGASGSDYFTSAHFNDVWSSGDGVTWRQEISAAPFSPRRVHSLLGLGTRLHLIGGYGVSRNHDIWRSADGGVTWQAAFSHPITAP